MDEGFDAFDENEVAAKPKVAVDLGEGESMSAPRVVMGGLDMAKESKVLSALKPYIEKFQSAVKPYVPMADKYLGLAGGAIAACVQSGSAVWQKADDKSKDMAKAVGAIVTGILLVLYGGNFVYLIAAVEAYRICGWESTRDGLFVLIRNIKEAHAADSKDDDENEAVLEKMKDADYLKRKFLVVCKAINPTQVTTALQGIAAGFFAVVATLKVRFAASVTLGYSIGEMLERVGELLLLDILKELAGDAGTKWVQPALKLACRQVGIICACLLSRVVWAFHCSLRGGDLIVWGLFQLAITMGIKTAQELKVGKIQLVAHVFKTGCAVLGFFLQLAAGFALPWFFRLLALPLTMLEWWVRVAVYWCG